MFDPVFPVRDVVRSVVTHFQKAVDGNVAHGREAALARIKGAVASKGAVVGAETHGMYAHADFMCEVICAVAEAGGDRLYIEMFHERHQDKIDDWQDRGDASGLIWLMNKLPGHSEKMWQRFWQVLQMAKACGMRVVAVEPDSLPQLYPGMQIFFRNLKWQDKIEADQRAKGNERPYVLYCGEWHVDRARCANATPIHGLLKAAAFVFDEGAHCLVPPLRAQSPARMFVPRAADQTPLDFRRHEGGRIACTPC